MIAVFGIISAWAIPVLVTTVLIYASWKKIPIFDTFVEGGKEGFNIAISLLPYMVGMLVALGIFRESGAFDLFVKLISPITNILGIPGELVPLAELPFGGGSGAGVSVQPVGFLVVGQHAVRLLPVSNSAIYDRLVDLVPQIMDKVQGAMSNGNGNGTSGSMQQMLTRQQQLEQQIADLQTQLQQRTMSPS